MNKQDIQPDKIYIVKATGKKVIIVCTNCQGGWTAREIETSRYVRVKKAEDFQNETKKH